MKINSWSWPRKVLTFCNPNVYCTHNFAFVLYGSLRLREDHRQRFVKTLLRTIYGPKRDEAAGYWSRLHNEELRYLYSKHNVTELSNQEH